MMNMMNYLKTKLRTYASAISLAVISSLPYSSAFGGTIGEPIIVPQIGYSIPELKKEMQIGPDESLDHEPFLNRKYDLNGDNRYDAIAWFRKCKENELPFTIYYIESDTDILNNSPIDEIVDGVVKNYGEKIDAASYELNLSQYSVISAMPPCTTDLISMIMS